MLLKQLRLMPLVMLIDIQGVVPENMHTPPTEGIGNSLKGVGVLKGPKTLSRCVKLDWNFQRDGGPKQKPLLCGRYRKILGPHKSSLLRIGHVPCK